MTAHEVLREDLAPLQAGGARLRTENAQPRFAETIDDPRHERRLRTDDREVDPFLLGK